MDKKWLAVLLILAASVGLLIFLETRDMPKDALKVESKLVFTGDLKDDDELSGIAFVGEFVVICSNEANSVQVLRKDDGKYQLHETVIIQQGKVDLDLESVAIEKNMVYVTGSHSRARLIGKKNELNGGRVGTIQTYPTRDIVLRFPLDEQGRAGKIETMSLRKILDDHEVLKHFVPLASKENGIDIEGIAAKDGLLYFGFRGPVLRSNWVPILASPFDNPHGNDVRYVQLGGRGIRDIAAVEDGFLILAGPVGDSDQAFQIYFWNGQSGLPENDSAGRAIHVCDVPKNGNGRAEGLGVRDEGKKTWKVVIVYDGLAKGDPTEFTLKKPD